MPRTARSIEGGMVYHVLNRGNGRMRIFHKAEDFAAFERVLVEGLERYPVRFERRVKGNDANVRATRPPPRIRNVGRENGVPSGA